MLKQTLGICVCVRVCACTCVSQSGILLSLYLKSGLDFLQMPLGAWLQCLLCLHPPLIHARCQPYMELAFWHRHRQWPRSHGPVGLFHSSGSRLCLIDIQIQQPQITRPLWQAHLPPVFIVNMSSHHPPSETQSWGPGLLWLSYIWQDYPRNTTLVCIWGTLWNILSSFVKRKREHWRGSPCLSGRGDTWTTPVWGKLRASHWLWEQMLEYKL